MSRIFIDRPIFAWVLAIIVMLGGHRRAHRAADRAISRHRADQRQHPRQLSGRLGRDGREQRHADPRAAAHRARRAALFQRELELARPVAHHRHVRQGHRSRHRPGAGAEQGPAGDLAPAAAGAAAGRAGHQVQRRRPADRRGLRHHRHARPTSTSPTTSSSNIQDPLSRIPGRRRHQRVRLAARDAHLARPAAAGRLRADAGRRDRRDPGPEHRSRRGRGRRPALARAGRCCNATVTAQSRLQTPEQFGDIVLKTLPSGSSVRIKDVARVELGAEQYNVDPAGSTAIPARACRSRCRPGADALRDRRPGQGARWSELGRRLARRARATPTPTTPPPSSAVGRARWSEGAARGDRAGRAS